MNSLMFIMPVISFIFYRFKVIKSVHDNSLLFIMPEVLPLILHSMNYEGYCSLYSQLFRLGVYGKYVYRRARLCNCFC